MFWQGLLGTVGYNSAAEMIRALEWFPGLGVTISLNAIKAANVYLLCLSMTYGKNGVQN